jgi:hypothetical protein
MKSYAEIAAELTAKWEAVSNDASLSKTEKFIKHANLKVTYEEPLAVAMIAELKENYISFGKALEAVSK